MIFEALSITDTGRIRATNEDVCAADTNLHVFLVADGMGGVEGGEVAAALFLETVREMLTAPLDVDREEGERLVRRIFAVANDKILAHAAAVPNHRGCGCTADLLVASRDLLILGHVGDSRSYCLRQESLEQLTVDHSLVQEQLDLGLLDRHQAKNSLYRNVLTRAVGVTPQLTVDIHSRSVRSGDLYLLCTDGLHSMLSDREILSVLSFEAPLTFRGKMLVDLANDAGGKDNISVTLVSIGN
jgi:PPM family protein phosphatase